MEVLVGAGGWDYYPTAEDDRLKAYSRAFRFVEVNSTFYHVPRLGAVRSWRRRVPRDFVFSVKCNGLATHVHGLEPVEETFRVLETMLTICRLLRSEMLVLQTPQSLRVDDEKVREVSKILGNLDLGEVQAFWEVRTPTDAWTSRALGKIMLEEGIVPVVDLSREDTPEGSGVVYSRLFSLGAPMYSSDQLRDVGQRVAKSSARRVVLAFHGFNMYRDAARFLESKDR